MWRLVASPMRDRTVPGGPARRVWGTEEIHHQRRRGWTPYQSTK